MIYQNDDEQVAQADAFAATALVESLINTLLQQEQLDLGLVIDIYDQAESQLDARYCATEDPALRAALIEGQRRLSVRSERLREGLPLFA